MSVKVGDKYFWCACGLSESQPLCNGSHSSFTAQPLEFIAAETKLIQLCGCKQTKNPPYCDGTHLNL